MSIGLSKIVVLLFQKIYFSFVAFSQNRRGGRGCGNFLSLTGCPTPPFLFVCFLFCLFTAVLPDHLSCPAISIPFYCPSLPPRRLHTILPPVSPAPAVSIPFYRPSLPPRRLHAIILSALPFYSSPFPPSATVAQCRTPTNCDKM